MNVAPPPQLSWVLPLYRTAAQLQELLARIQATSVRLGVTYEVILVDDACPEGSGVLAERLANSDTRLRVLRLARNHGQDRALREGLRLSLGGWTAVLDADLQDPPEAVAVLWPSCVAGTDAVFTRRGGTYSSPGRRLTSRLYRKAVEVVGGLPPGACLYVLLARPLVERLNAAQGHRRSLLAMIAGARARCTSVDIVRSPRLLGGSSYSAFARSAKAARSLWEMFAMRRLNFPL
jgi:glycosyltransferase involved in cell wall biosynthesis